MHLKLSTRYQEEAAADGTVDGVSGDHPAAGSGSDDEPGGDKPGGLMGAAAADIDPGADPAAGDLGDDKTGRPEWCPEQFWTVGEGEEPGTVNQEALTKSWKDTRAELKTVKENVGDESPEKSDDYVFTPPTETEIPYDQLADDDQGMAAIKIAAKEAGLSQKQYQTLVETFFDNCADAIPETFNEEEELAIVGKNGKAVTQANVRWCMDLMERGVISQQEYDEAMLMGATGYGVRFLAKVRAEATGELGIPLDAVHLEGALPSKAELHAQMGDPKYASDPAFRAEVDANFEKVYGNEPAGSSEQNMGISHNSTPPANIRRADEKRKQAGG